MRVKMAAIFMGIFMFGLFISIANVFASGEIPLPRGAILVKEHDLGSKMQQVKLNVYKISASAEEIKNFFFKEMKIAGWQGEKQKDGALMFQSSQDIVLVVAAPPRKPGSPTMFSITRSSKITEEQLAASKKDKPDTLSFMPIYPKSKQLLLMDLPSNGVSASYSTSDSIQNVMFFYKAQMPNYQWFLAGDTPVSEKALDCPSCKSDQILKDKVFAGKEAKGSTSKGSLVFRRNTGELCIIRVFSTLLTNIMPEVPNLNEGGTTILVTYNENKFN